jgi:arginine exporter protein ArgO
MAPLAERLAGPLRWVSAAVLLALAVRTAVLALRPGGAPPAPAPGRAFVRLLGLTLVNPMTVVAFTAVVLGAGTRGTWSAPEQLVFAASAFVASALWQLLLAAGGAVLGGSVTSRRGRLATALVSSAVLAVLALDVLRR